MTFSRYAYFYDLLYRSRDYQSEVDRIQALARIHCGSASSLIEFGCGTGRLASLLAQNDFAVHGVDISPDMIAEAQRRRAEQRSVNHSSLDFAVGDIRSYRSPGRYELAVGLFHVFSYLQSIDELAAAVRTAASHLLTGGLLIFDFWYGPAVLSNGPEVRVKRCEDESVHLIRIAEPHIIHEKNIVAVHYQLLVIDKQSHQVEEVVETHSMRYFFQPEIEPILSAEGFELVEFSAWPDGSLPSPDTWGVAVVAKKI
jgi:SAM-dependent methyltransferase